MHIPFNEIDQVIKKLCSLSSKKIITIDWHNTKKMNQVLGGYCFMHNYDQLFLKHRAKTVKINPIKSTPTLMIKNKIIKLISGKSSEPQAIIEVDII